MQGCVDRMLGQQLTLTFSKGFLGDCERETSFFCDCDGAAQSELLSLRKEVDRLQRESVALRDKILSSSDKAGKTRKCFDINVVLQ